ncbi:MAG: tetratricopeptide repeat protein [Bacteroidota bacterium]
MDEQSNINQIEAYLMDALNEQERLDFESRMARDSQLAKEVRRRKKMIEGVEYFGAERLKDRLKTIHSEVIGSDADAVVAPPKGRFKALYLLAAAAVVLLLLSLWFLLPGKQLPPAEIYAANFEAYDMQSAVRSTTGDPLPDQAKTQYTSGEYETALATLLTLLDQDANNVTYLLGAGNCYLQLGQAAKALPFFQRVLETDDLLFKDTARWYQALTYLKLNQPDAARPILQRLAAEVGGDFQEKAQTVLEQMSE